MAVPFLLIWWPKSTITKSLTVLVSELSRIEFCLLLGKCLKPSSPCPFHWCCFLQSTSSLVFGLVMTQAHCMTAGTAEGVSAEGFSACSRTSASPAWKYCHFSALHPILNGAADKRHLKAWKEMKALCPTGSHQELGIEPSFVLLEVFLQGFSAAANNRCAIHSLFSPTYFTAWKEAIKLGTSAQPVLPDLPIFIAILCSSIRTSANFIFIFISIVSVPAQKWERSANLPDTSISAGWWQSSHINPHIWTL